MIMAMSKSDGDLRILLIEAAPDDARLLSDRLTRHLPKGSRLTQVGRKADAARALEGGVFDVVLLDMDLPDSKGLNTLRRLRAVAPRLPFIVITASKDTSLSVQSIAEGAQDHLVKGEAKGALLAAILRNAIERQRLTNELTAQTEALNKTHENLSRLINASLDAKLVVDRGGRILFANPAATQLCGRPATELVGSRFDLPMVDDGSPELNTTIYLQDRNVMAEMRITEFEWHGASAFLVVLHDITQRLKTERVLIDTNRALHDSEARFQAFGDASPAALTIKDLEGHYLTVNLEFARRRGLSAEEIIGHTADDIFPPDQAAKIRTLDHEVLASDAVMSFEMDNLLPEGRFVEWAIKFPLHDADGKISGLGSISTDITQRKVAEEALQRSIRALRTLSACNEALIRARSEEGLLTEICRLVVEVGGYPFAWVGFDAKDGSHVVRPVAQYGDDDLGRVAIRSAKTGKACPASKAVQGNRPVVASDRADPHSCSLCETFFIEHDMHSAIALPLKNGKGTIGALMIFSRDSQRFDDDEIGLLIELADDLAFGIQSLRADVHRRRVEEDLRTLQRAVQQSPNVVMITDADGIIEYINPTFTEVTGYTEAEAIGQKPSLLRSGEMTEESYARLWSTIQAGHTWRGTLPNRRKDGSPYWVEAAISPVRTDDGRITHFIGIQQDITKRLETEKRLRQSEKMESLGNLAGGIAHDFNNMLLPMLTLSSMVMRDLPEGDRQRRRLEMVVEAAERARTLVQRILAFSRSGNSTRENTDMAEIVEDSVALLRVTLPRTIDVMTHVDPATGEADIDRAQVQTMILNLASNAADAMNGKPGRLEIDLDRIDVEEAEQAAQPGLATGSYAKLVIRDSGSGIPEEILPHIFEPFFTTKKVGEGTGLGLAMVHGIVTEHRGTISVESAKGVGTTIQILLPLRLRQEGAASAAIA